MCPESTHRRVLSTLGLAAVPPCESNTPSMEVSLTYQYVALVERGYCKSLWLVKPEGSLRWYSPPKPILCCATTNRNMFRSSHRSFAQQSTLIYNSQRPPRSARYNPPTLPLDNQRCPSSHLIDRPLQRHHLPNLRKSCRLPHFTVSKDSLSRFER